LPIYGRIATGAQVAFNKLKNAPINRQLHV